MDCCSSASSSGLLTAQRYSSVARCCPDLVLDPAADRSARHFEGPGDETNWLIPGRLLCGCAPKASAEWLAIPTHFVNLRDDASSASYRSEAIAAAEAKAAQEGHAAAFRARSFGFGPPQFADHPIQEFEVGGERICLEAATAVLHGLAAGPKSCVYLHCRAGHGRTGMVAAIVIGIIYPGMSVDRVMAFIQDAHDQRRDSWRKWKSPETDGQVTFARELISKLRHTTPLPQSVLSYVTEEKREQPPVLEVRTGVTVGAGEGEDRKGDDKAAV